MKHSTILVRGLAGSLAALLAAADLAAHTELAVLDGAAAGDGFGQALTVIGDVDGDGAQEFAVGAPYADSNGVNAGSVTIYSGRTLTPLTTLVGSGADDYFGFALAAPGDLSGDGVPDLLIGAPERGWGWMGELMFAGSSGPGYAVAVSGSTWLPLYTLTGNSGPGSFGWSFGVGGDLDLDLIQDFVVMDRSVAAATAYSGIDGAEIWTRTLPAFQAAHSAAIVDNIDGNGGVDVILGWVDPTKTDGGVLAVRGTTGADLWEFNPFCFTCEWGWSMAPVGDLDGDDVMDVVVGGRGYGGFGGFGEGVVRGVSGQTGADLFFEQAGSNTFHGIALVGLGDLDGDGTLEFAAGQPGSSGGEVLIYSGSTNALVGSVPPAATTEAFGAALASADINGDGLRELLVGVPLADDAGLDAGRVTLVSLLIAPSAYCLSQTNSAGCAPQIGALGTPSLSGGSLRVTASEVLNAKNGLLFWGLAPTQVPFLGGALCVQPPTARTALQQSGGSSPPAVDCSGSFAFQFTADYFASVGLGASDELYAQYWSRDPADPSGSNLSNALAFEIEP